MSSPFIGIKRLLGTQGVLLGLIILMFLIFFAQAAFGEAWYFPWMAVPGKVVESWHHLRGGTAGPADWQTFSTLVSYAFLHGSIEHVAGNMLFLWIFGALLVELIGWRWMLAVFLVTAFGASSTYAALNPGHFGPMLGASGAVMGFEGAYLGMAFRWHLPNPQVWPMARPILPEQLALVAVIGVAIDYYSIISRLDSNVAYGAHVGGFTVGLMLGALVLPRPRPWGKPVMKR